jgi:dipeptidyl aminopeptidase/acylaminoacyl peptidase
VEDVELTPDKKDVLYTSNLDDVERRHIERAGGLQGFDPNTKPSRHRTLDPLLGKTIEWHPIMLADGKTIVCFGSSATSPAMPYRLTEKGREMIAASALPKDFPSDQLVTPETVTFKSEDGLEIHGQLFLPKYRAKDSLQRSYHGVPEFPDNPALIFVHGGPPRQMMARLPLHVLLP